MGIDKELIMKIIIVVVTTSAYISYLPQIYRLVRRKCSEDISYGSWLLWVMSAILDTTYSFMLGDIGLIIYSSTELILNLAVLVLTLRYRKNNSYSFVISGIDCSEFRDGWFILLTIVNNFETPTSLYYRIVEECNIPVVLKGILETPNSLCTETIRDRAKFKLNKMVEDNPYLNL